MRAWEAVQRQTDHLIRLLDDLLDASRIARGKIKLRVQTIDLRTVVERAVESSRHLIDQRSHELILEGASAPVWLSCDPLRLTQVVQNLLHNAARYTAPGGRIEMTWEAQADRALLSVRDNGRGMPPELLSRVFDSFVQVRDGGRGLGLGLSLVKELVELHGGRVEARSEGLGCGSEIVVDLPLTEPLPAPEPAPEEPPVVEPPSGLRVVLIEDEDDIRELTRDLFEQWGHQVSVAANGRDGIDLILSQRPDVAIVDIGLPDIDGCEVARRICQELSQSRPHLIALSGYGQARDRLRSARAGFDAHLVKPAMPEDLEKILADLTGRG
jgi:CheY-like chemotaxis protein/two-component sensor histidine kinase